VRVVLRQAWQQKHPSPSHAGWDFHWHPRELPGAAQAIAQAREGVGACWSIGPRHVVWLRAFEAVAASEQRRYVGWAGCAAEVDDPQAVPAALAHLRLPEAAPFAGGDVGEQRMEINLRELPAGRADSGVARAAWAGGEVAVSNPQDDELPALFGSVLAWLPVGERASSGAFGTHAVALGKESHRNLVHYLHRAWQAGARRPWRLLLELAASERMTLADLFEELTRLTTAWESPAALVDYLGVGNGRGPAPLRSPGATDAGRLWNRVLHYWGRGFLDVKAEQLAQVLARRIVCDHLLALDTPGGGDPERYLRRLRFEAMLQARDVRKLRTALAKRLPSLEVQRERA
jgi:hypothetical protein